MKKSNFLRRTIAIFLFFAIIIAIFIARLIQIQIVDHNYYFSLAQKGSVRFQPVEAARGEILDRNLMPYVVNKTALNVIFSRAYMPPSKQNEIILKLVGMLTESGEEWTDSLPMQKEAPYDFIETREASVTALKNFLGTNQFATADDIFHWLVERYKLEAFSKEEARLIAGVRYEMELRGYNYSTNYVFAQNISLTTAIKIKEYSYDMPGVDIGESQFREYVNSTIAPHVVGLVGPIYPEEYQALKERGYRLSDTIGKSGIEKALEGVLRGKEGTRQIDLDANGKVITELITEEPQAGNSVILTIDSNLQAVSEQALIDQIKLLNQGKPGEGKEADSGAVVVLKVKTGEVLVSVSYPSYDLSLYHKNYSELASDPLNPLFNRALEGTYTPGSIYKPSVATAGLELGILTPSTTVNCARVYTLFDDYQPTCMGYHGNINVLNALRHSCNIFFYDTGYRVGIENLNTFSAAYGLGSKTGVEINEASGQLAGPAYRAATGGLWYPGDVLQASIGQSDNKFSPIQLCNYAATIARRGVRIEPHFVKSLMSYDLKEVIEEKQPNIVDTVPAKPEVFESVVQGMVMASRIGTAANYFGNYPVDVASKTGTPEAGNDLNSTFICFAPADDPEIAIAVVIEKGWHGYTGAPVAKAIFDAYFGYEN